MSRNLQYMELDVARNIDNVNEARWCVRVLSGVLIAHVIIHSDAFRLVIFDNKMDLYFCYSLTQCWEDNVF